MANIMSMKDIRNRPSRNGFDLSSRINFTAKSGELLPVWYKEVLPTDKFTIDLKTFTRTQPVNTAAQARMAEYYDFYFVPFDLLWNKFPTVVTQMNSNSQHAVSLKFDENKQLSGDFPRVSFGAICGYLESLGEEKNSFGFDRALQTAKLLQYLRYGNFYSFCNSDPDFKPSSQDPLANDVACNIFPLLAYQKIYADYFRYTQWEASSPSTFNVDYVKGTDDTVLDISQASNPDFKDDLNFFDMRYCNYQKDLFHGVLPVAQYGSAGVVPVSGGLSVSGDGVPSFSLSGPSSDFVPNVDDTDDNNRYSSVFTVVPDSGSVYDLRIRGDVLGNSRSAMFSWNDPALKVISDNAQFNVPVLALRQAEFLQKWKEVALSGEEDYKSQIQKHWGISISEHLSGMCRYLGGSQSSLEVNEVLNNNITGDNAADIAGKGTMSSNGKISFDANGQYGIIMCIYHVLPLLDYTTSGFDPFVSKTNALDIAIPEMDQIGMESVKVMNLTNPRKSVAPNFSSEYLGYAPRYIDYKTSYDYSLGAFTSTLRPWLLTFTDEEVKEALDIPADLPDNPNIENSLSLHFFKVNPRILDQLFAVAVDDTIETDQFLCFTYFDVKAVRSLDVNGLPY